MSSVDTPICVGCGSEMPHLLRSGYRRCHECVATDRPHSLAYARQIQASRRRATHGHHDLDPAGRVAA